jgi:hypothetical protein
VPSHLAWKVVLNNRISLDFLGVCVCDCQRLQHLDKLLSIGETPEDM